MAKLINWIDDLTAGEAVEAIVFGEMDWDKYNEESVPNFSEMPKGKILSLAEARPWLEYNFDDGLGTPNCQPFVVWTKTRIISVTQYDGSTSPFVIMRNPTDYLPEMPGG